MATSPYSIDPTTYLDELLAQASPDLMREMLQGFINQILSTQADQVCGADYATVSQDRVNTRNGYHHRDFDTLRRHRGRRRPETPYWLVLPRLVAGTSHPGRTGPDHRDRHVLSEGRVYPQDERPGRQPGHQQLVEVPGVRDG
ncbi:hypothetical protein CS176_0374 [Corynebacterium glutamicum]|nr:hypothetical protein CS176_0374 [Corynebacterium glutamicum]